MSRNENETIKIDFTDSTFYRCTIDAPVTVDENLENLKTKLFRVFNICLSIWLMLD